MNDLLTIICGDALEELRKLPSESVHCCITSPPYFGLRDYGTAQWEGGDDECDHKSPTQVRGNIPGTKQATNNSGEGGATWTTCGKCCAHRIDSQLGLEKTPELFVQKMVEVFREVRRTLRPDGAMFLNLGDSHSSLTLGVLREDLSDADHKTGLQIVWKTLGMEERERILSQVLPEALEQDEPRTRTGIRSQILPEEQGGVSSANQAFSEKTATTNDSGLGREVRVLWGNGNDVSVPRPHQRQRSSRLQKEGRPARSLAASDSRRFAAGQIPDSLLELQLSFGLVRLLSAREIDLASVPSEARRYFKRTLKPKDLCGIPWKLARALQKDGWWLRSDIIWAKPNPMPESVTDRPTKSHEYLFLMTKSANYFYDAEAIKERASTVEDRPFGIIRDREWGYDSKEAELRGRKPHPKYSGSAGTSWNGHSGNLKSDGTPICEGNRNKRSVWTVATAPYPEAHFATYPPDLIKPCILAGTSAKGCCDKCGSPWERIVESSNIGSTREARGKALSSPRNDGNAWNENGGRGFVPTESKTIGWQPTCKCEADTIPCTVLDPFAGSGTTGMVALELGRKAILIELNPKYVELIRQRCDVTPGLALA